MLTYFPKFFKSKNYLIPPLSIWLSFWNFIMLIFLILNVFFVPLEVAFFDSNNKTNYVIWSFKYIPMLFIVIDAFVSLNTGFFYQGYLHSTRKEIFIHYFKSLLLIDFLSLLSISTNYWIM